MRDGLAPAGYLNKDGSGHTDELIILDPERFFIAQMFDWVYLLYNHLVITIMNSGKSKIISNPFYFT